MVFGILSLMSFQLADSAFISQLGVLPLATQGFTMPLQMVVIGIQVGLGIATTAVISRIIGKNNVTKASQMGGFILLVGSIMIFILAILLWLTRTHILKLLNAPADVMPYIDSYWPYWLLSAWLGALLYFANSVCRANGNTFLPGILMMLTSLLNILLDPLFIFYYDLGLIGAAIATILSFLIGLVIIIPKIFRNAWVSLNWQSFAISQAFTELNKVMLPAMMSQLLPPLSSMLATKIIAGFGVAAVAGWAMASRIEFFTIVLVLALTMSLPAMIGRLFGAGDCCKILSLVKISIVFTVSWQCILAFILFLTAAPIAQFLSTDQAVQDVIYQYLNIVPISLTSLGVCMLLVSICNALNMSIFALLISTLRLFVCYLPLLWGASLLWGLSGVFYGVLLGNMLAGIMAWYIYFNAINKKLA